MDPSRSVNGLALFAGYGGLELGIRAALGSAYRTVCYVEREAYAAATLASRMASGDLDPAPIWDDVRSFDALPWRSVVDLVAGGFPCQDISNAGLRTGLDGDRSGLWSEFARVVREVRPRYIFVENVAALAVRGLDRVLADLATLGFDAEWDLFRASDVGAPHQRERLFIFAWSLSDTDSFGVRVGAERGERNRRGERAPVGGNAEPRDLGPDVGNPDEPRLEGRGEPRRGSSDERNAGPAGSSGLVWPPGPSDAAGWERYLARNPGLEPALRRGSHGAAARVDRLRLLGNGVVPQQAEHAFRVLSRRAFEQLAENTG